METVIFDKTGADRGAAAGRRRSDRRRRAGAGGRNSIISRHPYSMRARFRRPGTRRPPQSRQIACLPARSGLEALRGRATVLGVIAAIRSGMASVILWKAADALQFKDPLRSDARKAIAGPVVSGRGSPVR